MSTPPIGPDQEPPDREPPDRPYQPPDRRELGAQPVPDQPRPVLPPAPPRLVPRPVPPYQPPELPPQRPGSVTAAAVILFGSAGLGALGCCGLLVLVNDLDDAGQRMFTILGGILAVVVLLNVLLGYFLLQGRQWARVTTIVICTIGIGATILSLILTGGQGGLSNCVGLIVNITLIALLSGSAASEYFRAMR